MANEAAFNKKFRKEMERRGMKLYRVENHASCPGMPDNHYIVRDLPVSGWMEIKEDDRTEYGGGIQYRPQQVPWLLDYALHGGNCWTVVHLPKRELVLVIPGRESGKASRDVDGSQHHAVSLAWDDPFGDLYAIFVTGRIPKPCTPFREAKGAV